MSKRITRREFIKGSAAGGVAVGLGLKAVPAVGRVLGANDRIALGVESYRKGKVMLFDPEREMVI